MTELSLTTMLTTISTASASFVAILGGFVASKLLSVNGEREAVARQITDLTAQIDQKQSRKEYYRYRVNEHDAISFIVEHINELNDSSCLLDIYDFDDPPEISIEDLQPFWDKALAFKESIVARGGASETGHEDETPLSIADQIKDDSFLKELSSSLIQKVQEENQRKSWMEHSPYQLPPPSIPYIPLKWYNDCWDKINGLSWEIEQLELQKKLLKQRESELYTPQGIKLGLWVFALFSVFNIVLPLTQCNVVFQNRWCYYAVMLFFLGTFMLGLAATFIYLVTMLKWHPRIKDSTIPLNDTESEAPKRQERSE